MYNETQKRQFIDSCYKNNNSAKTVETIFNRFEKFEEELKMDISYLPATTLQPIIDEVVGMKTKTVNHFLTILKQYVRWCKKSGFGACDGVYHVKVDFSKKIKNQMVSSPLDLKNRLDIYFDEPEMETIDIIFRVYLWMAFAGLEDVDAIQVEKKNVDFNNMAIYFKGHAYQLYAEALDDFQKACDLVKFKYMHRNPDYIALRQRTKGNLILRGLGSSEMDLKRIRRRLNMKLYPDKYGLKDKDGEPIKPDVEGNFTRMSYNRIYFSGIFYRAYELETAGFPVGFSEIVARKVIEKEKTKKYKTTKYRSIADIANTLERDYKNDYEEWKRAFFE